MAKISPKRSKQIWLGAVKVEIASKALAKNVRQKDTSALAAKIAAKTNNTPRGVILFHVEHLFIDLCKVRLRPLTPVTSLQGYYQEKTSLIHHTCLVPHF